MMEEQGQCGVIERNIQYNMTWYEWQKKGNSLCRLHFGIVKFIFLSCCGLPLFVVIQFSASAGSWTDRWRPQQLNIKKKYSSLMMRRKQDELMTKRSTRSPHLLGILDDDVIISGFFFPTEKATFHVCGYCLYGNIFKCPQTTRTPWREQLMLLCCYCYVLHPLHANIQVYNENGLAARQSSTVLRRWSSLQEGAEGVIHRGKVQVLGMAAVRLHLWFFFLFVLAALTGERLPPADGAPRATVQTRQDHLGEVLLEPLEVLPEKVWTRVKRVTLKHPISHRKGKHIWLPYTFWNFPFYAYIIC